MTKANDGASGHERYGSDTPGENYGYRTDGGTGHVQTSSSGSRNGNRGFQRSRGGSASDPDRQYRDPKTEPQPSMVGGLFFHLKSIGLTIGFMFLGVMGYFLFRPLYTGYLDQFVGLSVYAVTNIYFGALIFGLILWVRARKSAPR